MIFDTPAVLRGPGRGRGRAGEAADRSCLLPITSPRGALEPWSPLSSLEAGGAGNARGQVAGDIP